MAMRYFISKNIIMTTKNADEDLKVTENDRSRLGKGNRNNNCLTPARVSRLRINANTLILVRYRDKLKSVDFH